MARNYDTINDKFVGLDRVHNGGSQIPGDILEKFYREAKTIDPTTGTRMYDTEFDPTAAEDLATKLFEASKYQGRREFNLTGELATRNNSARDASGNSVTDRLARSLMPGVNQKTFSGKFKGRKYVTFREIVESVQEVTGAYDQNHVTEAIGNEYGEGEELDIVALREGLKAIKAKNSPDEDEDKYAREVLGMGAGQVHQAYMREIFGTRQKRKPNQ